MSGIPRILSVGLATGVLLGLSSGRAAGGSQAAGAPSTHIRHTAVASFVPGTRILVWATVDDAPLVAFRCYFRQAGRGDYGFVDMLGAGANRFVAFLPAAAPGTSAIEYVLLAANARREVVRTGTFTMTQASATEARSGASSLPGFADETSKGEVFVKMDLSQAASSFPGFSDRIVLVGVPPEQRFGQVVGGLYANRGGARDGWPADCRGYDIVAEAPAEPLPGVLPAPATEKWDASANKAGSGGVSMPQAVRSVKPRYTAAAMRAKVQGTAVVECLVMPDGTVGPARLAKSLDPTFGLDFEAVNAARQWRFVPGAVEGKPVPVLVQIELSFQLR